MTEQTMKVIRWVIAGVLAALGLTALILHMLTKQKGLGKAAVTAIEASHKPAIEAHQKRVEELSKDMTANAKEIAKAKAEVEKHKAALKDVYKTTGMTPTEVKDRLSRLKL